MDRPGVAEEVVGPTVVTRELPVYHIDHDQYHTHDLFLN